MRCEEAVTQISAYLDGELTQQDSQRVRLHIEGCNTCGKTLKELRQVKETMGQLSYPNTDQEMLDRLENDLVTRTAQWSGWLLLLIPVMVLIGYGTYNFFTDPETPGVVRFFYGAFQLGMLILFGSVLRQRLMTYKNDKYRKVKL